MLGLSHKNRLIDLECPEWSVTIEGPRMALDPGTMWVWLPPLLEGDSVTIEGRRRSTVRYQGPTAIEPNPWCLEFARLRHGDTLTLRLRGRKVTVQALGHKRLGFHAAAAVRIHPRDRDRHVA